MAFAIILGALVGTFQESPDLSAEVKGTRALLSAELWGSGGGEDVYTKREKELEDAIRKEGMRLVRKIRPGLFLIDPMKADAVKMFEGLPYRMGVILFKDGIFSRALPIPESHPFDGKGHVPTAKVEVSWGPGQENDRESDLKKWEARGFTVKSQPPAGVSGPSALVMPGPKGTLLEVFIVTGGQMHYEAPAKSQPGPR